MARIHVTAAAVAAFAVLYGAACGGPLHESSQDARPSIAVNAGAAPASVGSAAAPPEWRPGDRWVYDWTSGAETGSKTVEVTDIKDVNGVRYYVAKIGEIEHYYTLELGWAAGVRDSKVQARMVPPQPWFTWPLEVGRRWTYEGVWEERDATRQYHDTFAAVSMETVNVPAGRFEAVKIVRESSTATSDQYWYVPVVRSYVRWIGQRGEVQFEELLREYRPAPRLIPEPMRSSPPPAAR